MKTTILLSLSIITVYCSLYLISYGNIVPGILLTIPLGLCCLELQDEYDNRIAKQLEAKNDWDEHYNQL